jgi:hypothetical protein
MNLDSMHNILALVGKANKLLELTTLQGDAKRDSPPISVNKSFVVAPCSNPKEALRKKRKGQLSSWWLV